MEDIVEARGRIGTDLATVYDADGNKLRFDIREDEEQNKKLEETVGLLVAAGYFRARIKGLSTFDKVVGGMAWCVSLCNMDLDVDLLYQENSSIGQKIALTEKLVRVLPSMKCPHSIQPHQIQGLDFIHIFPVTQWLVKQALKAKDEAEEGLQSYAASAFSRHHKLSQDISAEEQGASISNAQKDLKSCSLPERIYKKPQNLSLPERSSEITATLIEYGSLKGSSTAAKTGEDGKVSEETSKGQDKVAELAESMSRVEEAAPRLSAIAVASLIDTQEIQKMSEDYTNKERERSVGRQISPSKVFSVTEQEARENEKRELEKRLTKLREKESKVEHELSQIRERFQQAKEQEEEEESERILIEELEDNTDPGMVERLKELMAQHEEMKTMESSYKEKCKVQLAELNSQLEHVQNSQGTSGEKARAQLEWKLEPLRENAKGMRLKLAQVNQEISSHQRNMDQTPSQIELNQYQRRFMELYNQVASKHRETKQFYILHNTLTDVQTFMEKEITLLESISESHKVAQTSEACKKDFLKQLEQIVEGIKTSLNRIEKHAASERLKRDQLKELHQELLDKQRLYYKTVQNFQEECRKNESLARDIEELENR